MKSERLASLFAVVIALLLAACGEKDAVVTPVPSKSVPAVPLKPASREERVAAAVVGVKQAAKQDASPKKRVDLHPLQGRKLNDLYAKYLAIPGGGLVPPFVDVSFDEVMANLYQQKVVYERCNNKTGKCKMASDTVLSQAPTLYQHYLDADKKKMGLGQFIGIADSKVISARKGLDWVKVCKRYKLNEQKCELLQAIVAKLAGKDLVAYGMTELLPSADGRLNVTYLDLILRNAGAEFLYHVPALADGYASLGLWQYTMYSVRKDDEVTEGASAINSFVKDGGEKIHDSVVYLDGHEHIVAAFYFAVHNLAELLTDKPPLKKRKVINLSRKGVDILMKRHLNYQNEVVMYIAAAHTSPGNARNMTNAWINSGLTSNLLGAYRGRIHQYAAKTKANLFAIYDVYPATKK